MRAVFLDEIGGPLRLGERADLEPKDPQELIRVTACGVCHSDLHAVAGDYPVDLPVVLGHEVVGEHDRLGPVMVYACWGCRRPDCWACSSQQEMICPDSREAGLLNDGGYAEEMLVPDESYLLPLGDLDPVHAAPLACGGLTAFRAVDHTLSTLRGSGRRRALVIGAGGLGQFAVQYLRQLTDAEVVAVDLSQDKRHAASELGADLACAPDDVEGHFDAVIDFVGAQPTLAQAAQRVRRQGIVVLVGLFGGAVSFGLGQVPHEARFMTSIWGSKAQLAQLIRYAQRHPLHNPVETMPLEQAQQAHERLLAGESTGRIVLTTTGESR